MNVVILDYDAFRKKYVKEHPASVPQKPRVKLTPRWLKGIILLAFFASALVSGAHTVTAVARTITVAPDTFIATEAHRQAFSMLSFAMVELVMFISAYMLVVEQHGRRLLYALLFISLSVAVSGNLDSTFHALAEGGEVNLLTIFVGLFIGVGAPLTTLLMGELFSRIKVRDDRIMAEAMAEYRAELKQFDANVLSAFKKYEREQTERQTDRADMMPVSAAVLSVQTDTRQTQQTGYGYHRTSDGQKRVVEYLSEHPDEAAMPLRQLAERIGVNKDTVSAGRRLWTQQAEADRRAAVSGALPESELVHEQSMNGKGNP